MPRSVAMKTVGHKTEAIYPPLCHRQRVRPPGRSVKLAEASEATPKPATGTIAGTIGLAKAKTATEAAR